VIKSKEKYVPGWIFYSRLHLINIADDQGMG